MKKAVPTLRGNRQKLNWIYYRVYASIGMEDRLHPFGTGEYKPPVVTLLDDTIYFPVETGNEGVNPVVSMNHIEVF